jgi:hypothetical protein
VKSSLSYGMPPEPKSFPLLRDFCNWAKAHHVRVLATFPNVCDIPEYHTALAQQTADRIEKFFGSINVPVLGKYTDSVLPEDHFYDTIYHMTEEAAKTRTERLATQVVPYLRKL